MGIACKLGFHKWVGIVCSVCGKTQSEKDFADSMVAAVGSGELGRVSVLLDQGVPVNVKTSVGLTGLVVAAQRGFEDIVTTLVNKGADLNPNDFGVTPLSAAAMNGHVDVVRFLLDKGANVHIKTDTRASALYLAAENGHTSIAEMLLNKGAPMSDETSKGMRAIDVAALNNHPDVVTLLLKKGAQPEGKNSTGMTPLMYAAKDGKNDALRILLDNGARYGAELVLFSAVRDGHADTVSLLIKHGLNPSLKYQIDDSGGQSLLSIAISNNRGKVAQVLRDAGVKA